MAIDMQISRPSKLSNAQTILYEIDMLRFTKDRLLSSFQFPSNGDKWIYLESFLLHYRNLLEFFKGNSKRDDSLCSSKPEQIWGSQHPDKESLNKLNTKDLWEKYESGSSKISKYLQHCTTQRVIDKSWDIEQMYKELCPVLDKFLSLLPEYKEHPDWRSKYTSFLTSDVKTGSTQSTRTKGE
jgi:hypothetical protein